MKKLIFFASLIGFFFSFIQCKKEDRPPACSVSNPLVDLPWLKAILADSANPLPSSSLKVYRCLYKERTVYEVDFMLGMDAASATAYDCQGTVLCRGSVTVAGWKTACKEVFDQLEQKELLYKR